MLTNIDTKYSTFGRIQFVSWCLLLHCWYPIWKLAQKMHLIMCANGNFNREKKRVKSITILVARSVYPFTKSMKYKWLDCNKSMDFFERIQSRWRCRKDEEKYRIYGQAQNYSILYMHAMWPNHMDLIFQIEIRTHTHWIYKKRSAS